MKHFFYFLALFPSMICAQENTFIRTESERISPDSFPARKESILVIPFQEKMYMSQIDKQLCERNNLNFSGLVSKMRFLLTECVAFRLADYRPAYSLYQPAIDSLMRELHFVYTSLRYEYKVLETEEKNPETEKKPAKIPTRFIQDKEKKQDPQPGTRIENGQVVSVEDTREKYSDCVLENKNLLQELSTLYNSTLFVFINQLDILYYSGSVSEVRIKIHYTFFDLSNKRIYGGAVNKNMPADVYDFKIIRDDYFYPLAIEISNELKNRIAL